MQLATLLADLRRFPWLSTGRTLLVRFREDRLGVMASSLTFTTTMALVPFFTVALAVFTAFPMFGKLQTALQGWLVQSVIPDSIAKQVLGYLTQFAAKASRLGAVGVAVLLFTSIALVLTIDRTLNVIWRVRRQRPLGQRVLMYWGVITLAPLLFGASLSLTSYVVSASRGLVGPVPAALQVVFDILQFVLFAAGLTALYRYVPHTHVRPAHALAGGLFAAIGIEAARRLLAMYLGNVPTYSLIYGAFATFPILLLWIYIVWLIVLWGAEIAAYLPSLTQGAPRPGGTAGWRFELALDAVRSLHTARATPAKGLRMQELTSSLRVDVLLLEPVMEILVGLDWVGRVNETQDQGDARFVLLAEPSATLMEPLVNRLLLQQTEATRGFWDHSGMSRLLLRDAL